MANTGALRVGLVGYGAWGRLHAGCLARTEGAELVAICCASEETAKAAAGDFPGAAISRDFEDMLADGSIDVVDIAAPNHLHCEMGVAAMLAGKHVLLEKPLAISIDECDRLVATQRQTGRIVSVGLELRQSLQWGKLHDIIDRGDIGTLRFINLGIFRQPFRLGADGWRFDANRVGSWILEEAVHFIDLILWYLPPDLQPKAVHARSSGGAPGMNTHLAIDLIFDADVIVSFTQCLGGFGHQITLEVAGDRGAARTWWSGIDDRTGEPEFGLSVKRFAESEINDIAIARSGEVFELEEMIRQTISAMHAGRALLSAEEARRSVVVCLEAERSIEEKQPIALDRLND